MILPDSASGSDERAQSETVGVLFLIAVVIVLVSVVGWVILGQVDQSRTPAASLQVDLEHETVSVTHDGGDVLELADLTLRLRGGTLSPTYAFDGSNVTGNGDRRFDPSEQYQRNHGLSPGPVTVLIVHEGSGTILERVDTDVPRGRSEQLVASFGYSPSDPDPETSVNFDGGGSTPSDRIGTYEWDFGDGSTATGPTPTHTFSDPGSYDVTLTVTTTAGVTASTTRTVSVESEPPVAAIDVEPTDPDTADSVDFSGSASTDPDGSVVAYDWDFGDGSTASGETVNHSYDDNGTYPVTLTVTDDSGLTNSTTVSLPVENVSPHVNLTASDDRVHTQEPVTFDGSGTIDSDGDVEEYRWDFGDGNLTTTGDASVVHRFDSPGRYRVELTAVDDDGATNDTEITVVVGGLLVPDSTTHPRQGTQTIVEATLDNNATTAFDVTALTVTDDLPDSTALIEAGEGFDTYANAYEVLIEQDFEDGFTHPPDGRAEAGTFLIFPLPFPHGDRIEMDDPGTVAGESQMQLFLMDFVDEGGDEVDMRGKSIEITFEIEYADGITDTETVTVRP